MATSDKSAGHRSVIEFFASPGMTPVQTYKKMRTADRHKDVSRALVYKCYHKYSNGSAANEESRRVSRPKTIDITVVQTVWDVLKMDKKLTVLEITDKTGLAKSSVHQVISKELQMSRVCARWVHMT